MIDAEVFDFMLRAGKQPSLQALLDDLLRHANLFGFEHLIFSGVPVRGQQLAPMVDLNGWPREWFDRYVERNYASVDGVCLFSAQSIVPFDWADVPSMLSDTIDSRRVMDEASEFGIRSGYAVPMLSTRHSWQSVVSFGSSQKRLRISDREKMQIVSMAMFTGMALERGRTVVRLTERETEVLHWAATGKSAWQISVILNISESAVRKHEANARRKFGVATTVQAAIAATRQRLINP